MTSFEEVAFRDLVVGVKYKMKSMPHHHSYYTGIFKKHNGRLQEFEHVIYHGPFRSYELYFVDKFYYIMIPQKEKIQQAMELRALHKVLRGLLDEHFTWE